jgi:hypothetical protein
MSILLLPKCIIRYILYHLPPIDVGASQMAHRIFHTDTNHMEMVRIIGRGTNRTGVFRAIAKGKLSIASDIMRIYNIQLTREEYNKCMVAAIEIRNRPIIRWLNSLGEPDTTTVNELANHNLSGMFPELARGNAHWEDLHFELFSTFSWFSELECVKYFAEETGLLSDIYISMVCTNGSISVLEYLDNVGAIDDPDRIFVILCRAGRFETAKWHHKKYEHCNKTLDLGFRNAVNTHQVQVAKWLTSYLPYAIHVSDGCIIDYEYRKI